MVFPTNSTSDPVADPTATPPKSSSFQGRTFTTHNTTTLTPDKLPPPLRRKNACIFPPSVTPKTTHPGKTST